MMRIAVFVALTIGFLGGFLGGFHAGPANAFEEKAARPVLANAVSLYIQPTYGRLLRATDTLANATAGLCFDPSEERMAEVEARFEDTVRAWSKAEIIRLGPVLEENRLERFLFYPDRRSIGTRQVEALLASGDDGIADPEKLAARSVAVQGLGAFEQVMFETGRATVISTANSPACLYGEAIALNLVSIASELFEAWMMPDGIAAHFTAPGPENPLFRNDREAITALLGLSVHGAEMLRDQRIEKFYRGAIDKGRPRQAIYWRSGNTMPAIVANLEGLRDLWMVADMQSLLDEDMRSVSGSILFDLDVAIKAAMALEPPTAAALADEKYRSKLDFLLLTTRDLIQRLNDDFGMAIGLSAGFSFSDGD